MPVAKTRRFMAKTAMRFEQCIIAPRICAIIEVFKIKNIYINNFIICTKVVACIQVIKYWLAVNCDERFASNFETH